MKKRLLALLLSGALILSLTTPAAFAEEPDGESCDHCGVVECVCPPEAAECEVCGEVECICAPAEEPEQPTEESVEEPEAPALCEVCNADPCTCEGVEEEQPEEPVAPVCPGDDTCTIEGCENHVVPEVCETCGEVECECEQPGEPEVPVEKIEESKESELETQVEVGDVVFAASEGLAVEETSEEKKTAIEGVIETAAEQEVYSYDISSESDSATITVEGLVPTEENCTVYVMHLLDSAEAILALEDAPDFGYFVPDHPDEFVKEIAAGREAYPEETEDRVYYDTFLAEIDADGNIVFATDSFSTFIFVVKFEYKGYQFSMSGGGEVLLSEIMMALGIKGDAADVVDVEFSDDTLFEVTKIEDDWNIKSLAPFGSEEFLTITFANGKKVEVLVKDPTIYNYAVGSDITNVPKKATRKKTFDTYSNGDEEPLNKTYLANTKEITNAELITAAGTAASADIIIYAAPGMAIGFEGGTVWGSTAADETGFARPKFTDKEIWYWSWIYDSKIDADTQHQNYIIVKEGTAGQQATFSIQAVSGSTKKTINITLCSVENSDPVLLADDLPEGYSIKNVPVTLYNYDGKAWNEHYDTNKTNYFAFSGASKGVASTTNATNRGWTESGKQANGGGGVALMGIVKDTLVNGLPVMSQGQKVDLFSTATVPGKTVYSDVNFQFAYNESTGYYAYNSALNHAQYNSSNNTIELYKQSLATSDTPNGASHGNAGFYPFEDINKAYTNTGFESMSEAEWKQKLEENAFELIPAEYSTDIVQSSSTDPVSTVDLHYGIQISSDFYLPKGKELNGKEMVYSFTGDDDLWVFIDGKLVLDIGGGHTHVSGSFNLTTGEVWVEKYTKLAAADGGSYATRVEGTDLRYTDSFITGLKDDQMHTIQIFYLERHGGVSNCRMWFNLPLVPSNAVHVSKSVKSDDGNELAVTPDKEYTFTLYTAEDDDDNIDATNFSAYTNAAYTVTGSGAPTETQYTDATTGEFTLKDGWLASFEGIKRFTEVCLVETDPNGGKYIYPAGGVSINGEAETSYNFGEKTNARVMQLNTSMRFDFTNYMEAAALTIKKVVQGKHHPDAVYNVTVNVGGKSFPLTFNGAGEERITEIPVNMDYTVSETDPSGNGFNYQNPLYNGSEWAFDSSKGGTIGASGNTVTITNRCKVDLKISKTGWEEIDPNQSFIFLVKDSGGNVVNRVAVHENGSVVLKDLDVGTYSVEEVEPWSWRYTATRYIPGGFDDSVNTLTVKATESDSQSVNLVSGNQQILVVNDRDKELWLDGNDWCQNIFGETAAIVTPAGKTLVEIAAPIEEDEEE